MAAGLGTTQRRRSSLFFANLISDHEETCYFLDSCFLCKTLLHGGDDIYMYRDTPFCSEDCRLEQIEMDEAKERKNWQTKKLMIKSKIDTNDTTVNSKSHEIRVTAGEAVVAS